MGPTSLKSCRKNQGSSQRWAQNGAKGGPSAIAQGLGTFQSVLSARSKNEGSLAEVGSRSKLEAVKGEVDKRVSTMHFRPGHL